MRRLPIDSNCTVFAAENPICGIYHYACELVSSLNEVDVPTVARPYLFRELRRPPSRIAIHNYELGQSIRKPLQTALLLALLLRFRFARASNCTVVHSYYSFADLHARMPAFAARAVMSYQLTLLRVLGAFGTLVALDKTITERLAEADIASRTIEFGVYDDSKARRSRTTVRTAWGFPATARVMGFVGHPMAFKRYADFLRLFVSLQDEIRAGWRLVYVGGDRRRDIDEWRAIERAFSALPTDVWKTTGMLSTDDLAASVAALDLCVMPYDELSQGSAVLALAAGCGTPCIVSNARLFDDVVRAGGAVPIEDLASGSADALCELLDRLDLPLMRARMSAYAESHSLAASAQRFVDLLDPEGTGPAKVRPL